MHKLMLISLTCSLIGEYSKETSLHLKNLQILTSYLSRECKRLGLIKIKNYDIEEYIKDINYTSVLHDIGKMAIPSEVLEKDAILTEKEKNIDRRHPEIGASYIKQIIDIFKEDSAYISYINFLKIPYEICKYHHERWNGNGYPEKLKGEEIPIAARIVSVADTYEALRGYRTYKQESEKQFDPKVVEAFLNINHKFEEISYEFIEF